MVETEKVVALIVLCQAIVALIGMSYGFVQGRRARDYRARKGE